MDHRTRAAFIIVALIASFSLILPALGQENIAFVNDPGYSSRVRPPVPFPHDQHNELAGIGNCASCHHVFENGRRLPGESSEGTACSECHSGGKLDLTRAYHLLCRGCHLKLGAGPVLCVQCHPKP